eukprot:gene7928-9754_t
MQQQQQQSTAFYNSSIKPSSSSASSTPSTPPLTSNDNVNNPSTQNNNYSQSPKNRFNFIKGAPELIILCGPAGSGKTNYYHTHYSNYVRVSACDLFKKNLSFGLVIKNYVIKNLADGKNVVIDDTNHITSIRESYISALSKNNTPISSIILINFQPSGGELQLQWQKAWKFCEISQLNRYNNMNPIYKRQPYFSHFPDYDPIELDQYKIEYKQPPMSREGYTYIKDITTPLYFNTTPVSCGGSGIDSVEKQFKNKALFLDSRTIIQFKLNPNYNSNSSSSSILKYNVVLKERVEESIRDWLSATNVSGGVALLKRVIVILDEVSLFPASLDMESESPDEDFYRSEIKKCLNQLATLIKFPVYFFICPKSVQEFDFYRLPNLGLIAWSHYRHRIALPASIFIIEDSDNTPDQTIEEYLPNGKIHGVFFPDEIFDYDIDDSTTISTSSTTTTTSSVPNNNNLNNNIDKEEKKIELPFLTNDDLRSLGIDEGSVVRGLDYSKENRLLNIELTTNNGETSSPSIKVTAQCQGTSKTPYSLIVRYRSKSNGGENVTHILETDCSCPNGIRTYGKCKHIVTLILYCNSTYTDPSKRPQPTPTKLNNNRTISPQRVLPKWMTGNGNDGTVQSNNNSSNSSVNNTVSPNKRTFNLYHPSPDPKNKKIKQELKFVETPPKNQIIEKPLSFEFDFTDDIETDSNNNNNNNNNNINNKQMVVIDQQKQEIQQRQQQLQQLQQQEFLHKLQQEQDLMDFEKMLNQIKPKRQQQNLQLVVTNQDGHEFEVPRSNSEETLLSILNINSCKNPANNYNPPSPSSSQYLNEQTDYYLTQPSTITHQKDDIQIDEDDIEKTPKKKKISLRALLESQGIKINLPPKSTNQDP